MTPEEKTRLNLTIQMAERNRKLRIAEARRKSDRITVLLFGTIITAISMASLVILVFN